MPGGLCKQECHYEGGYISCPLELLQRMRQVASSLNSVVPEAALEIDMEWAIGIPNNSTKIQLVFNNYKYTYLYFIIYKKNLFYIKNRPALFPLQSPRFPCVCPVG